MALKRPELRQTTDISLFSLLLSMIKYGEGYSRATASKGAYSIERGKESFDSFFLVVVVQRDHRGSA
jgi:hypothetical protein